MSDKRDYVNCVLKMEHEEQIAFATVPPDERACFERALSVRKRVLLIASRIGESIMAKKPVIRGRVVETASVAPFEPMPPKVAPPSKVLTVRLPTPIVDALNKHKQDKNVEMSAIVRPILEKVLTPIDAPLIENAPVKNPPTAAATPAELPAWMGPWGRMFFAS